MKIAFFSTQPYDSEYFELYRKQNSLSFFTDRLNSETVNLATGHDAVCAFENNHLSEDIIQDDVILRLMSFPNVLITAHQGFLTEEALTQISLVTIQNVDDFEAGRELVNKVA